MVALTMTQTTLMRWVDSSFPSDDKDKIASWYAMSWCIVTAADAGLKGLLRHC